MPITPSAMKRMRSDKKKEARNSTVKSRLKTLFKDYTVSLAAHDSEKASAQAQYLMKEYDKAVSRGIIPRQRANRKKARIAKHLHRLITTQADKK